MPTRWWGCISEDEKKEMERFFIDEKEYKFARLWNSEFLIKCKEFLELW